MSVMEKIITLLASVYYRIFGSKRLSPIEKLCLEAWRGALPDTARKVLDAQLHLLDFVQKQAAGAKVCFFWASGIETPLFDSKVENLHAATIILGSNNGGVMPVKIFVHRGRFFSIEFPKRPGRYMEQHNMNAEEIRVLTVKICSNL
jgi:hypothetical protein